MYRLKQEWIELFKELKNGTYEKYIGCSSFYISGIVSGSKLCSETLAKALISVKDDISFKDEQMPILLEKYFAKEK